MQSQVSVLVPLRARDGSVRAYTLIDKVDEPLVTRWAWRLLPRGYVGRSEGRQGQIERILLHRVLLGLVQGDGLQVDHINRVKHDNRRENLCVVTHAQQRQNVSSYVGASSRYRGVRFDTARRSWVANVRVDGKQHHLGCFADEQEAAQVARDARRRLMPYSVD